MRALYGVPVLFALALTLCAPLFFVGCGGNKEGGFNPFLSGNGTGVRGLDTPDQILSNPYVKDAIDAAGDEDVNITFEKGVDPPVISGNYNFTGEACAPGYYDWGPLVPGTWKWSNQTADNHIDTKYDQVLGGGGQHGIGTKGEIIRGTGNNFTVYSILDINDEDIGGCKERAVLLFDGQQDSRGNISGVYIFTSAQEPVCHATTIGRVDLTLTGAAKAVAEEGGDAFLIMMIRDSLQFLSRNIDTTK